MEGKLLCLGVIQRKKMELFYNNITVKPVF